MEVEKNISTLNINDEVNSLLKPESNVKTNSNANSSTNNFNYNEFCSSNLNNFNKVEFSYNNKKFELCVSSYSNLIFIIVSTNGKLGSFYLGEVENKDLFDNDENLFEIRCLLGNRKDEINEFFCNNLIIFLLNKITNNESDSYYRFSKIGKILFSTSIKFTELFNNNDKPYEDANDVLMKDEFKEFLKLIKMKISELLNI
jgi:hypothetical protein